MLFNKHWTPPSRTYDNWDTAPMVFHKIVLYLFSPISILYSIYSLYSVLTGMADSPDLTLYYAFDLTAGLLILVMTVCSMVFLAKRDWKGPRLFLLRYLVAMVYNGVVLLLTLSFSLPVASIVGTILGELIVFAAGYRYYQKRRPLFTPVPSNAAAPAPATAPRTCPRCGEALPWDGRFCPRCGEPTPLPEAIDGTGETKENRDSPK